MSDTAHRHAAVESHLRSAFSSAKDSLDSSIADQIEEFLDNNEYGLALEDLALGITTSRKTTDRRILENLLKVAVDMGMSDCDPTVNLLRMKLAKAHDTQAQDG